MRVSAALAAAVAFAVAVSPPLDAAASEQLSRHMVQHLILLTVAAPLLAAAFPGVRAAAGRQLPWMAGAVVLHTVVLLGWHVPALYDAAERSVPLHAMEHITYLVAGFALWASVFPRHRAPPSGWGVLGVFVVAVPCTLLGAALTFASTSWYASYPAPGAVADQQLAGVIMWAFGGLAYLAAALVVFSLWLARQRSSAVVLRPT